MADSRPRSAEIIFKVTEAVSSEIIGLAPRDALDKAVSEEIGLEGFGPERILEDRMARVMPDFNP